MVELLGRECCRWSERRVLVANAIIIIIIIIAFRAISQPCHLQVASGDFFGTSQQSKLHEVGASLPASLHIRELLHV